MERVTQRTQRRVVVSPFQYEVKLTKENCGVYRILILIKGHLVQPSHRKIEESLVYHSITLHKPINWLTNRTKWWYNCRQSSFCVWQQLLDKNQLRIALKLLVSLRFLMFASYGICEKVFKKWLFFKILAKSDIFQK